jgi:hypothetical protein
MDLNSIAATSVAIRAGQVAAAELCNLLTHEEDDVPSPIEDWFDPRGFAEEPPTRELIEELGSKVDRLGGYVCHSADPVSGERLYRWAVIEGIVRRGEWADQTFARHQAYDIFALTVRAAYTPLKAEQARLAAEGAPPPQQLGLALEDSIFEETEGLGAMRPEAIAAAPLIAAYDQAAAKRAKEPAKPKRKVHATEVPDDLEPHVPFANNQILSIGEAPVKPPVNRGGRGKRKSG